MDTADRLLTVEELANYLDVPIATIYAWRHRRQGPPGFRVGKHLRFRWSDIQQWIEDRLPSPVASERDQSSTWANRWAATGS